jgi:nucleoid-associated protein YgaU
MGPELYPGGTSYTTAAGDTLASIADGYQVLGGWQRLAELNHISDPNMIYPGQVLNIE